MKRMENRHYTKTDANGNKQESIDWVQSVMGDKFQYGCWFNVLKYPIRVYEKHDTPNADIKKIMHYCLFWLNDLNGNASTSYQDDLFELFKKIEGSDYNNDYLEEMFKYTTEDLKSFTNLRKDVNG